MSCFSHPDLFILPLGFPHALFCSSGYVFITNIPAGATDILIIERRKTENILGEQRGWVGVETPDQLAGRWEEALCTPTYTVREHFLQGSYMGASSLPKPRLPHLWFQERHLEPKFAAGRAWGSVSSGLFSFMGSFLSARVLQNVPFACFLFL